MGCHLIRQFLLLLLLCIEFGLACVLPDRDCLLHQKVGTSGYMAPEILRGLRYNGFLSDIWSMQVVSASRLRP